MPNNKSHGSTFKYLALEGFPGFHQIDQWLYADEPVEANQRALQPIYDMGKDAKDTFKPYESGWEFILDLGLFVRGIGNIVRSLWTVMSATLIFLGNLVRYSVSPSSRPENCSWTQSLGINFQRTFFWAVNALASLVRGVTQIAATIFTLPRILVRAGITLGRAISKKTSQQTQEITVPQRPIQDNAPTTPVDLAHLLQSDLCDVGLIDFPAFEVELPAGITGEILSLKKFRLLSENNNEGTVFTLRRLLLALGNDTRQIFSVLQLMNIAAKRMLSGVNQNEIDPLYSLCCQQYVPQLPFEQQALFYLMAGNNYLTIQPLSIALGYYRRALLALAKLSPSQDSDRMIAVFKENLRQNYLSINAQLGNEVVNAASSSRQTARPHALEEETLDLYQLLENDIRKAGVVDSPDFKLGNFEDIRLEVEQARCEILLMPSIPSMDTLDKLPLRWSAAYIRSGNELFYVNKIHEECIKMDIDPEKMTQFDAELKPTEQSKLLSSEELKSITLITGHIHQFASHWAYYILCLSHNLFEKDFRILFFAISMFFLWSDLDNDPRSQFHEEYTRQTFLFLQVLNSATKRILHASGEVENYEKIEDLYDYFSQTQITKLYPSQKILFCFMAGNNYLSTEPQKALMYYQRALLALKMLPDDEAHRVMKCNFETLLHKQCQSIKEVSNALSSEWTNLYEMGLLELSTGVNEPLERRKEFTITVREFLAKHIEACIQECHQICGQAPCSFSALGAGALARGDFSLGSEVNVLLLLQNVSCKNHPYFQTLLSLIQMRLIAVTDSKFPMTLPVLSDLPTHSSDSSLKSQNLLKAPATFVAITDDLEQQCNAMNGYAYYHSVVLFTDEVGEPLFTNYHQVLTRQLNEKDILSGITKRQKCAKAWLSAHANQLLQFDAEMDLENFTVSTLREHYYAPLAFWCQDMAMYFGICEERTGKPLTHIHDILMEFQQKQYLSMELIQLIRAAFIDLQRLLDQHEISNEKVRCDEIHKHLLKPLYQGMQEQCLSCTNPHVKLFNLPQENREALARLLSVSLELGEAVDVYRNTPVENQSGQSWTMNSLFRKFSARAVGESVQPSTAERHIP